MKAPMIIASILFLADIAYGDTLRCGSKIVDTGLTMQEVKKYCGEPTSTSVEEQDVRAGNRVVGKTQVYTWRYARSSGQNTAVLVFDQDKLMSIAYESK